MAGATIEIGGKDKSGAAFQSAINNSKRLQSATQETAGGLGSLMAASKKFGAETRDSADVGAKAMEGLSSVIGGRLSTAAKGAGDVIKGFMSGGLWGAGAAAVKSAIELISSALEAAKERAMAFSEHLARGFQAVADDFAAAKSEAADLAKDMDDAMKVANGAVASSARMKVHALHIETLQKITDGMSEAGKKDLEAEEKLAAANIVAAANAEMRENERKAAHERVKRARDVLAAAEERSAEVEEKNAQLTAEQIETIAEHDKIKRELAKAEEKLATDTYGVVDYEEKRRKIIAELAEFEKEHADTLKLVDAGEKARNEATAALTAAQRELTAAKNAEKILASKHNMALADDEAAVMDCRRAREESAAALREAKRKEEEAAAAAAEKAEKERQLAEIEKGREEVEHKCKQYGVDAAEALKTYTKAIEDGHDATIAVEMAENRLAEVLDERAEAEKAAAEKAKKEAEEKKKKEGAEAFAAVKVEIDALKVKEAIDASQNPRFQDMQRMARDARRRARDELAASRRDIAPTVRWLKGEMTKEQAALFEKHLFATYNQTQVKDLMKKAMESQIVSKSEQMRQEKKKEDLLKQMVNMGIK